MNLIAITRRMAKKLRRSTRLFIAFPGSAALWLFGYRTIRVTCDCTRIGHLLCEIDCLVKEIKLGIKKQKKYLIFYEADKIANEAFLDLLPYYIESLGLPRWGFNIATSLFDSRVSREPIEQYAVAMYEAAEIYSINSRWRSFEPVFSPLPSWKTTREEFFRKWGLPTDAPFVCIHAREAGYSSSDEHYHSNRNVDIELYRPAVMGLVSKGVAVVRMGDQSMKPLGDWGPMVFDYATCSEQAPWLDLAISANCLFFLSGSSGAFYMATIFGRPVAGVGMALPFNFSPSGLSQDIGVPKLFRHKLSKEMLSFDAIFHLGLSELRLTEEIDSSGYELVENSPQEVSEVVDEMYLRLANAWVETSEDRLLQEKIKALLRPGSYSYGTSSKCGAMFLRRYSYLFETELEQAA